MAGTTYLPETHLKISEVQTSQASQQLSVTSGQMPGRQAQSLDSAEKRPCMPFASFICKLPANIGLSMQLSPAALFQLNTRSLRPPSKRPLRCSQHQLHAVFDSLQHWSVRPCLQIYAAAKCPVNSL
jgi:hypothetical protein